MIMITYNICCAFVQPIPHPFAQIFDSRYIYSEIRYAKFSCRVNN